MKISFPLLCLFFDATGVLASINEAILAQGLMGSHFGIPGLSGSFDYVIAGGGTAGLTLARRLAANTSISVAVIEVGDFYEFSNGNLSEIPADAASFTGSNPTQKNPLLDWYQYTARQTVGEEMLLGRPRVEETNGQCPRVWLIAKCFTPLERYLEAAVRAISCGITGTARAGLLLIVMVVKH